MEHRAEWLEYSYIYCLPWKPGQTERNLIQDWVCGSICLHNGFSLFVIWYQLFSIYTKRIYLSRFAWLPKLSTVLLLSNFNFYTPVKNGSGLQIGDKAWVWSGAKVCLVKQRSLEVLKKQRCRKVRESVLWRNLLEAVEGSKS